jgi:hypothetical protein
MGSIKILHSCYFRFANSEHCHQSQVVSATTKYQRMDVYDVLRPGVQSLELYRNSLLNDGSYEAQHPDLFAPDRIVFLDGVLQSRRSGDAAYHGAQMNACLNFPLHTPRYCSPKSNS